MDKDKNKNKKNARTEKRQKWWSQNKNNVKREEKREGLRKNPTTTAENKFTILPKPVKNKSGFKTSVSQTVKKQDLKNSNSKVDKKSRTKQSKLDFKKVKNVPSTSKTVTEQKGKNKMKNELKAVLKPNVHIAGELPPSEHALKSYVLFIGNLPYSITKEQLEEHFKKTGGVKVIRIPTDKTTGQCKGFAYIEFKDRISHGIALRLHQTTLCGRKINVEFTSIGGKNKKRLDKLKMKNLARSNFKKPLES